MSTRPSVSPLRPFDSIEEEKHANVIHHGSHRRNNACDGCLCTDGPDQNRLERQRQSIHQRQGHDALSIRQGFRRQVGLQWPCAGNWPPLKASAGAKPMGDYSTITRDDGSKQWAYKGRPLYTWKKDKKPGDITGDGFLNGAWHFAQP